MEKKFYMITINKDNTLFANVYDKYEDFLKSVKTLSKTYPLKLWELRQTTENNFDLVITKSNKHFLACLRPKIEIKDKDKSFIKCIKKEIDVSEIK